LHNEELNNFYHPQIPFRQINSVRIRWGGHVAPMGKERKVYKVGKADGKRQLGIPRSRWD
jgi:hypothetical protein